MKYTLLPKLQRQGISNAIGLFFKVIEWISTLLRQDVCRDS